ncbi:helicase-related protein [uncultured Shewanella sp.]|uniref:helicase-related protein n=1 Tax=uncultured Shewanella sp. TaxID=173975 RepID=UPI00261D6FA1|nr:helicase-related protein [uncultured Shewanella sp.]
MYLPIDALREEFMHLLCTHHLVVESETGSGKSTRLPLWASQLMIAGKEARVLVIEPRRVACLALSEFVSTENAQANLELDTAINVGYSIRFDSTVVPATQVAFVTPGVALRWLNENGLADFDLVIFDEFHERRWDMELLLAILKQQGKHKLVVTSATMNTADLTLYLQRDKDVAVKHLKVSGRQFPVKTFYQSSTNDALPELNNIEIKVKKAIEQIINIEYLTGDILVFLPGKREINKCEQACRALLHEAGFSSAVLHGGINHDRQKTVLVQASNRRVIFSTNVAETSLTIPGVTAVIDSGLERRTLQRNGRTVLALSRISHVSCEQRKGRAGRTQSGVCIRLWGRYAVLDVNSQPELMRNDLVEPMLAAAAIGYELSRLDLIDMLPSKALSKASETLMNMAAIEQNGKITLHGKKLFPLPIDTLFSHLISGMDNAINQGLMIDLVAALSVGQKLITLPSSMQDRKAIAQWEPLNCDAMLLIKIMREPIPDCLSVDLILLNEAKQLANQIHSLLNLSHDKAVIDEVTRESWLLNVIKVAPELAFVRREKRYQALGNGYSEIQIGRSSRFIAELISEEGKASPLAAVVFDQFSVAGKGVKQTVNFANCMAPISFETLVEAQLGIETVSDVLNPNQPDQTLLVRQYAGRVIGSRIAEVRGDQLLESIVGSIIFGAVFPNLAKTIERDICAWNIWLQLQKSQYKSPVDNFSAMQEPICIRSYLTHKLRELGVESADDLELINASDLVFHGIPEWERVEFDRSYPQEIVLPELMLAVEYSVQNKWVILSYVRGSRKQGPKRWELPRWSGWRIKYQKASRVIEIK